MVVFDRACGSCGRAAGAPRRLIDSRRRAQPGLRGIWSTEAGLGGLAEALAAQLSRPPRLNSRARSVRREDEVWAVQFDDAELRAGQLILATPAREAAELLGKVSPDAAEILSQIEYAPVVSIALGTQPGASERPIEGFGFLVPRDAKLSLLGCLFMSRLFPKRAPEGRELLQCMVGGTRYRAAVECPEDQLVAALHADLERTLGLRAEPEVLQVMRWPRAVPQPGRRHPERMAALRKALDSQPGLQLAGAYLAGVSVADSGASGVRAAQQIGEG